MMKYFTLNYRVNKMVGVNKYKCVDGFLEKALNNEFSPSEKSLKSILAFSDAYSYTKSKSIGDIENVLN